MKIDVLSQNTLKLTLSKLDMFDLDIKYESLSGKNPETKRLLSHVIKSIQSDKKVSFDFSGERLFIEAFPRIDGGCMLYISCLEEENARTDGGKKTRRPKQQITPDYQKANIITDNVLMYKTASETPNSVFVCELKSLCELGGLCRCLCRAGIAFTNSLYELGGVYRLVINTKNDFLKGIAGEFGQVLGEENALAFTEEYFKLIAENNAVKIINDCV